MLGLAAAPAMAACVQGNLAGRYQIFMTGHETENDITFPFWQSCLVKIRQDGTVVGGTACIDRDLGGTTGSNTVKGGNLTLASSCRIRGRIKIGDSGGNWSIVLKVAWLSANQQVFSGVAVDGDDLYMLTAIRR